MTETNEYPSQRRLVLVGHFGMETVCECREKVNPRLRGGGPGGASSPSGPEGPLNPSVK